MKTSAAPPGGAASTTSADGEPAASRRVRRRAISVVGLVLVLVGVGLLGYVGWQYYGTDFVSKRHHAAIIDDLHEQWKYPTTGEVVGPAAAAASLGTPTAVVRIPRFGSDYEVPLIEGVRDEDLSRGIGHFPGAGPGQIGNFALAAHRVTHGEPFRGMPALRPGDLVIVEMADAVYTYALDTNPNDLVVPFTESWVIDPVPVPPPGEAPPGMPTFDSTTPSKALITLTTCSELFHTDDRMVAFGHLVTTERK